MKLIPLLSAVLAAVLLVTAASSDSGEKKYGNISSEDYKISGDSPKGLGDTSSPYSGYEAVAENTRFKLFYNRETGGAAVYDGKTGQYATTLIPQEEIENAHPYNEQTKSEMLSSFVLTAVNTSTGNTSVYTSYDGIQSGGGIYAENIENGIRITYVIGKIPKTYTVPDALSGKRYKEILGKLSDADAREFANRYAKFNIEKYYGSEREKYIKLYPTCTKEDVYILNNKKDFVYRKLENLLKKIGYTEEDKERDTAAVMSDSEEEEYTVFRVPIEIKLYDDRFSVSLDREGMRYGSKALPVYIELCPYLMRGGSNESGYMLLPDGSGSIIKLNNGKVNADSYSVPVYGTDPLYNENFEREKELTALIPTYGISLNGGGKLAYISSIAADASVTADISGKTSDTNRASCVFKLFGYKKEMVSQDWTTSGNGTVYAVRIQGDRLSGRDTVDYFFLADGENGYSDMAAAVRGVLKRNGTLDSLKTDENTNPLLLDIMGSYDRISSFLGIPKKSGLIMTDYSEALSITEELKSSGISADVKYSAALNGGYKQSAANRLKTVQGLGSRKQAAALKNAVNSNGGKLYYDLSFTRVYKTGLFYGFDKSSDSAASLNEKHTAFFDRDPVSFYFVKNPHYLLAPARFEKYFSALVKNFNSLSADGIAFRNIGGEVYSDTDAENFRTKSGTAAEFAKGAEKLGKAGVALMYGGGNEYIIGAASYITDAPYRSNEYALTDRSVPFYQMVLHGYVPYSYGDISLAADEEYLLLYSAATGAHIKATVSAKSSSELKLTDYTGFYNTEWSGVKTSVIEGSEFLSPLISAAAGKEMLDFSYLTSDVTKTIYSGLQVYVNFSDTDFTGDFGTVRARNYLIVK